MFSLDGSLGAALLGNLASAVSDLPFLYSSMTSTNKSFYRLYGVTVTQACTYYVQSKDDRTLIKILVGLLLVLDSVHLGLVMYGVYTHLITHFGILILKPDPSLLVQILVTSINNVVVRTLFALRVWRMSKKNRSLLAVIVFAIWFTFACSAAFMGKSLKVISFWNLRQFGYLLYMSLSTGAFVDILTCGAFLTTLRRSRTGWERTDSLITTFSLYTINTGALISLCSILTLLMFALLPDTLAYVTVFFCMDSVFFNALLATLNARAGLRERLGLPSSVRARHTTGPRSAGSDMLVKIEMHSGPGVPPRKPSPTYVPRRAAFELPIQPVPSL